MRLKSIKLAGFKSFVDPTTVPFPGNMTAVVGPNGCGKSNIIDAVRWVMGESSAKYLRGESMSDVIFNGSNSRKPVGQASIELVFDNSDGGAPGEFAPFNEISVRRRVTREGQSEYFMNKSRCRRRDITDLFLGTGLGPRSYAIIEQGMISRLIEAKPEELRNYIEEAAGISRYKERRRETESRMRRTVENIERLTDLRDELGRQLEHLERQARAAEKYRSFKQDERRLQAELAALRWQGLDNQLQQSRSAIGEAELELEKALGERLSLENELERLRDAHGERSETFNRAQGRYYEAGAEIARVEQNLEHQKQRSHQSAQELDQALANRRELERELEQDEQQLNSARDELAQLEPELARASEEAGRSSEQLARAESQMADWQQRWERFSQRSADERQKAEVEQSRIQGLEDSLMKLRERRERLLDEQRLLKEQIGDDTLSELEAQSQELGEQRAMARERLDELSGQRAGQREALDQCEAALSEGRDRLQTLKGTLASQQALLEEQRGDHDDTLNQWLDQQSLAGRPRLAEQLQVTQGWEKALETVLGPLSRAISLEPDQWPSDTLEDSPAGLSLVQSDDSDTASDGLGALVRGAGGASGLLQGISTADSLAEARQRQASLAPGESLVTPDGTWLGKGWLRRPTSQTGGSGLIERRRQVTELSEALDQQQVRVHELEEQLAGHREQRDSLEAALEQARSELSEQERQLNRVESDISAHRARSEQIRDRVARISEDLKDLSEQEEEALMRLEEARAVWQEAMDGMNDNADEKETLLAERDRLREQLDQWRQDARHERDQSHQLQLQVQTLRNQRDGLQQTLDRMQIQRERLSERVDMLQESRESAEDPIADLELELEGLLERRVQEEERLSRARDALEDIDQQVRTLDGSRSRTEQRIEQARERLEKLKMDAQALELRSGNHLQELEKLEVSLKATLEQLPEEATEESWQQELEKLAGRIQRLGAINLAAIDEYRVQSERKNYLDEQHEDLQEALDTLESAIRRIDRETRNRFKETFDQVNSGLQALFPKVFGGGSAYLALTGEDLLETGVTIMARPPGKKNSTIHLLSGGEKALTAIALVFSIFQLNPAPFCMLDEVDAPLDDANVGRYANMVKEMSKQVQFIYITHNKISMELADQLMGVTMHEPGVSRLVSVDVEAAAALAEA
ncbi:MAG: chromosome segregation protein SMC [Oleiphilaceae bacterium]|nr:chromosome segregation protein SMC [Oleiphilaceae bacterium]